VADYYDTFPEPVTRTVLERGQQRYTIFCAVCHDPLGTGNGKIVERGYLKPPAFSTDLSRGFLLRDIKVPLREAPVGYLFEVVTQGFGAMPEYAGQVPVHDRWAIVAYVRALQLSQRAPLAGLPEDVRKDALQALEGKP
jgi:mono/diheme cytochrome c family protein